MESEFQLKFAALVFQSHSEIMLNMIQTTQKNEFIVLSFPWNSNKLIFPSSMVINLWECSCAWTEFHIRPTGLIMLQIPMQIQTILYVKCWKFVNPKWSLFATDTIRYNQQLNTLQGVFNKDDYQMSVSLLANIQDMFELTVPENMLNWCGLSRYTEILAFCT